MGTTTSEDMQELTQKKVGAHPNVLIEKAKEEKGGHCIGCSLCLSIIAILPRFISGTRLRSDNISVQVKCSVDPGRKYPFRPEDPVGSEECTSLKRHRRRHVPYNG